MLFKGGERYALLAVSAGECQFDVVWPTRTVRVDFFKGNWTATRDDGAAFELDDMGQIHAEPILRGYIEQRWKSWSSNRGIEPLRGLPSRVLADTLGLWGGKPEAIEEICVIREGR